MTKWQVVDSYGTVVFEHQYRKACGTWIDPVMGIDFDGKLWGKITLCKICGEHIAKENGDWVFSDPEMSEGLPTLCYGLLANDIHAPGKKVSIDHERLDINDDGTYTVWVGGKRGYSGGTLIVRKVDD